jgi:hypothetical protein
MKKKKIIVTLVIVSIIASLFTVNMFAGGVIIPIPTDPTVISDDPVTEKEAKQILEKAESIYTEDNKSIYKSKDSNDYITIIKDTSIIAPKNLPAVKPEAIEKSLSDVNMQKNSNNRDKKDDIVRSRAFFSLSKTLEDAKTALNTDATAQTYATNSAQRYFFKKSYIELGWNPLDGDYCDIFIHQNDRDFIIAATSYIVGLIGTCACIVLAPSVGPCIAVSVGTVAVILAINYWSTYYRNDDGSLEARISVKFLPKVKKVGSNSYEVTKGLFLGKWLMGNVWWGWKTSANIYWNRPNMTFSVNY